MLLKISPYRPKIGETRLKKRFAWLPVPIGDRYIWLERYLQLEAWIGQPVTLNVDDKEKTFMLASWQVVSRKQV